MKLKNTLSGPVVLIWKNVNPLNVVVECKLSEGGKWKSLSVSPNLGEGECYGPHG